MRLQNKRVGVFVEEGFEDLEFWVPVMRLREEGAQVTIIGSGRADGFRAKHCLEAQPDVTADRVSADDFDARTVYEQGKIIGSICHAGWVLASAGIVKGHRATGSTGIKDDLINAGAVWVDQAAFRDGNIVWGRVVKDIPDFCRELVNAISET